MGQDLLITVNGETKTVVAGTTIADLVTALGGGTMAAECNQKVVPRKDHANHVLCDGDRVELVGFVGGG